LANFHSHPCIFPSRHSLFSFSLPRTHSLLSSSLPRRQQQPACRSSMAANLPCGELLPPSSHAAERPPCRPPPGARPCKPFPPAGRAGALSSSPMATSSPSTHPLDAARQPGAQPRPSSSLCPLPQEQELSSSPCRRSSTSPPGRHFPAVLPSVFPTAAGMEIGSSLHGSRAPMNGTLFHFSTARELPGPASARSMSMARRSSSLDSWRR
jgi:hypothetical protein